MEESKKISGVILAVDFGSKKSGLAICDPERRVAVGVGHLEKSGRALARAVFSIAREKGAESVLVGSPPPGAKNVEPVIAGADKLCDALRKRGMEVLRWDEGYTTAEALRTKKHYGGKSKPKKMWIDEASAILILQSYLTNYENYLESAVAERNIHDLT